MWSVPQLYNENFCSEIRLEKKHCRIGSNSGGTAFQGDFIRNGKKTSYWFDITFPVINPLPGNG
jgi:hypothetical protein